MVKYKLEKISDDKFNGLHPNGFDAGLVYYGYLIFGLPQVGAPFFFNRINYKPMSTSLVTKEIDGDGIFKTSNSTYCLIEVD